MRRTSACQFLYGFAMLLQPVLSCVRSTDPAAALSRFWVQKCRERFAGFLFYESALCLQCFVFLRQHPLDNLRVGFAALLAEHSDEPLRVFDVRFGRATGVTRQARVGENAVTAARVRRTGESALP